MKPVPAVIMFHGGGGTARGAMRETGWARKADAEGFLAVFPEATPPDPTQPARFGSNGQIWNDGSGRFHAGAENTPDVAFVDAVVNDIIARYNADPRRLYATGFSNGASMAFRVGVELSARIAAIAPVAGALWIRDPKPDRPVPLYYITGDADPLNPIDGGVPRFATGRASADMASQAKPPVRDRVAAWARMLGCREEPAPLPASPGVTTRVYGGGRDGTEVRWTVVADHGHIWPGGRNLLPEAMVGKPSDRFNATDAIWEFFRTKVARDADIPRHPNIVVLITDDQGYADFEANPRHPKEVSTPHMDALAREGVLFTQAYISGSVCSPTRAGLMLGRYQHRVGVYTGGDGGRGFDPKIPIFPSFLPDAYVSTAIGKWHLGLDEDYPALKWHALNRGFDECYKFMGRGGHDYFRLAAGENDEISPLYRGKERIDDRGYLTTRLAEEAVAFIGRNKAKPFFLYLAFNAVHAPAQAPKADIDRIRAAFPGLSDRRVILMAMLHHLDLGVGSVVAKLKAEGVWDNTLFFFLTDNGGSKAMEADNTPLRGFKHSCYEGGIRTPFIVSWPARFAGSRAIDTPVISLDILPTALDAVGAAAPAGTAFDGKSLLPLLTGATTQHHDVLHWDNGGESGEWAVRQGDWKVHGLRDRVELFNLAADPSETTNLADRHPDRVRRMTALHEAWIAPMPDPINGKPKRWVPAPARPAPTEREQQRQERKKLRDAEKKARKHPAADGAGEPQSAPTSRSPSEETPNSKEVERTKERSPERILDAGQVPGIVHRPGQRPGPTTDSAETVGRAGRLARPNGKPAQAPSSPLRAIELLESGVLQFRPLHQPGLVSRSVRGFGNVAWEIEDFS